jgi:mRNA-degrading endonuclease RelE of RelBE toxin-antitoxin system
MAHRVVLEQGAADALATLRGADRARVLRAIRERLTHEPEKEDTNRKRLRDDSLGASWELRVQPYRVYYDVDEATQTVWVVKLARKNRETAHDVR